MKCEICEKLVTKKNGVKVQLYDYPHQDNYREVWVHSGMEESENEYGCTCYDLLFDPDWADFRYFECQKCLRIVCRQSPGNGWHVQVRETEDGEICLRCYEKQLLENGVSREKFENKTLPGMFFSFGNSELLIAGWDGVRGFQNYYVNSQEKIKTICDEAMALIDKGQKVIVAYESMGIGGGEGYVSLFSK